VENKAKERFQSDEMLFFVLAILKYVSLVLVSLGKPFTFDVNAANKYMCFDNKQEHFKASNLARIRCLQLQEKEPQ